MTLQSLEEWRARRVRLRLPAILSFAFIALALLGSALLVWSTIASERAQRAQADRTRQVMAALADINRATLNAETGQRGYTITLDPDYLDSYLIGRELYPRALARLETLLAAEDDEQLQLLGEIERYGNAKFAELARTVAMIEAGDTQAARALVLSNEGKEAMMRLRRALAELERIEQALLDRSTKEAADAEEQILPLLALMIGLIIVALAVGYWQARRVAVAEVQASQAQKLAEARDRADLLAREINHRVKNLFAVILAIVRMSARESPEARPVVETIAARIHALLDAHEITKGTDDDGTGGQADVRALVETVLAPHRSEGNVATIDGPEAFLTAREATPVGLVLHELATNAVKYGAWSQDGGQIAIGWRYEDASDGRAFVLNWKETCRNPQPPGENQGFGSMLMQGSARQLGGSIERRFDDDGIAVEMRFVQGVGGEA